MSCWQQRCVDVQVFPIIHDHATALRHIPAFSDTQGGGLGLATAKPGQADLSIHAEFKPHVSTLDVKECSKKVLLI